MNNERLQKQIDFILEIDLAKTIMMALIHDVVEIDEGDT